MRLKKTPRLKNQLTLRHTLATSVYCQITGESTPSDNSKDAPGNYGHSTPLNYELIHLSRR